MSQIELVILDFDGTLVDTAPDLIRSANLYLKSKGVEPLSEERIRSEIGMGLRKLILDLYPDLHKHDENLKRQIEAEFLAIYEREFLHQPVLFEGALDFLSEWDRQIAIVSNKRTRFIHPILQKLRIDSLPWARVIGGDSFANMKPHPEPFLAAMQAAGVTPEETLVVGDGAPDVEGALAVGSLCVAVEFGYTPAEELINLGAWKAIAEFAELLPLIDSMSGSI
jgi:HAD superfamily hydrolase (TIGR01509 family)